MSAGYIIYSLDWGKFLDLVNRPTKQQLKVLAEFLRNEAEDYGDDDWPSSKAALAKAITQRLAQAEWYEDLSDTGKTVWDLMMFQTCRDDAVDVGFRVDSDGVYWDVIDIVCADIKKRADPNAEIAMQAFGNRPFRCGVDPGGGEWSPMHSMHAPDDVRRMLEELRSAEAAVVASGDEDARQQYEEELIPALERIVADGRGLFIQVDT